jgi:hypothetical protein
MAPHVYNFIRHNQYAQTKREPSTLQKAAGFLGKAALVGAGLGALYGASDAFGRGPGPSVDNETLQSDVEVPSPQNEVSTQQGADIPAASFQEDPNQYVVGSYPLASPQTEYPPDKYFSPRGDYNDPENIKFGLPTNKAGRTQLSKFIDTLHAPQINEELIDDNSQLVDHPDQPPGEVPHTPEEAIARSQAWAVSQDLESQGKVKYDKAWHAMVPTEGQVENPQTLLPRTEGSGGIRGVSIGPSGTDPRLMDIYQESRAPGSIEGVKAYTTEVTNPEFAQSFQEDIGDQYGADWSQEDLKRESVRNLLDTAAREGWTKPIRPRVS